jgi:hypothetical protein
MQFLTIAALVATASASVNVFNMNSTCDESQPKVRVVNRCPYKVHLWSVLKGQGCPGDDGVVLEQGAFYQENYRVDGDTGVSIKISKGPQCKIGELLQLEYFIETNQPGYNYNYLDVSYVDGGNKCPTKHEGYYLQVGNIDGQYMANDANEICPVLSCNSAESCAAMSYINPDDRQTKSCDSKADMNFYMCGGDAPGSENYTPAPVSSAEPISSSEKAKPTSQEVKPSSSSEEVKPTSVVVASSAKVEQPSISDAYNVIAAAAVTSAPEQPNAPNVKTQLEVVYVTKYEYVNAKRSEHGHRHQHFRA